VYRHFPDVQTHAEESTAWAMVSRPTYVGGLGFGYKWDMGWMHDTLKYFMKDPVHRKHHQNDLTFRMLYAYNENFVLPLSHDEVVHGKGPLWDKMAGDEWQKFAGLRLLFAYQWAMTGKKLLFMGGEIGQRQEWRHDQSIDWHLVKQGPFHKGVQSLVRDLNKLYASEPALHELDNTPGGFEWVDCTDAANSVISFVRKGKGEDVILCVFNFTPVPRPSYRLGVPGAGSWQEVLNTDADLYGGSNVGNSGGVYAEFTASHGQRYSVQLNLPPLGAVFFKGKV
jgi:1,4-alpha-glucan branching enzyme